MSDKTDNGVNDDAFGDGELSALYQQMRNEQPPEHIDEAVLALAKQHADQHTHQKPHPVSPFSARWPVSASMVAVLILAFGLVTFMQWELGSEKALTPTTPAPMNGGAKKKDIATGGMQSSRTKTTSAKTAIVNRETAGASASFAAKSSATSSAISSETVVQQQKLKREEKALAKPQQRLDQSASPARTRQLERSIEVQQKALRDEVRPQASSPLVPAQMAMAKKREMPAAAPVTSEDEVLPAPLQGFTSQAALGVLQNAAQIANCRDKLPIITAQDYWRSYIEGAGHFVQQDRVMACVVIDRHGKQDYRHVTLASLQDRGLQRQEFIAAIEKALASLTAKALSAAQRQAQVQVLQRLTSLQFNSSQQWQDWYVANRSSLVLSQDGKFIVSQGHD